MKRHKHKILFGALIIAILAFVFWYGGDAPGLRGWVFQSDSQVSISDENTISNDETKDLKEKPINSPTPTPSITENTNESDIEDNADSLNESHESSIDKTNQENSEPLVEQEEASEIEEETVSSKMEADQSSGKDKYLTDPVPEGKPLPVEPQDAIITNQEYTCFLSVRCDTILNNMSWLDPEKIELVPADGIIFAEREVHFYEGESVFDVLLREMKQNKIHMEYESTPIYNSAYIEGIANLYEFDCGELSGWMYRVNGWFPNYGCSRYQLMPGDIIEWVYTCDLGADVGGSYSTGGN